MSKQIVYLSDFEKEADQRRSTFGRTDKHSTGFPGLDEYMGQGFGNQHGYEIITVFGESGIGKSSFVLNMISHELQIGTKTGLLILEDDIPDVYNRVRLIVGDGGMRMIKSNKNLEIFPSEVLDGEWSASTILQWIKDKHDDRGIELFVLDHINFVFDNEEHGKGEDRLAHQRKFMMVMNSMVKKLKITVIIVSHTAKAEAGGMNKIYGTTAIKQVSTKVLGIEISEIGDLIVNMYKSRFTRRQESIWQMKRNGLRLEEYGVQPQPIPASPRGNGKKGKVK